MPIYKQLNEFEEPKFEKGDLFYADNDFRRCTETVFVHLGLGDVSIETGTSRSDVTDELMFTQSPEPRAIGESNNADIGLPTYSPVRIVFDKPESVDIVADALQKIRTSMTGEPQGAWVEIRSVEDLPKGFNDWMVTLANGSVFQAVYSDISGKWNVPGVGTITDENPVIAYQPKPEPYTPASGQEASE